MLMTILIKNRVMVFNGKKRERMLRLPMKEPNSKRFIEMFLFKIRETLVNSKKSKAKFNSKIRSTYIFIESPFIL